MPAKTVVEGAIQRAAVAPFDGHIAQSFVRAGDTVQAGQALARLEDRELLLEQGRLARSGSRRCVSNARRWPRVTAAR